MNFLLVIIFGIITCSTAQAPEQPEIPSIDGEISQSCLRVACKFLERHPAAEGLFERLGDELPEICRFLNIGNIENVRMVCDKFRDAANIELNRRGPDLLILPVKQYKWEHEFPDELENSLKDVLRIKPKLAMFFTDGGSPPNVYDSVAKELTVSYSSHLPKNTPIIYLESSGLALSNQAVYGAHNAAVGMFLNEKSGVRVRVAIPNTSRMPTEPLDISAFAEEFLEKELLPVIEDNADDYPVTLIVFHLDVNSEKNIQSRTTGISELNNKIIGLLKQKYLQYPKSFTIWGSHIDTIQIAGLGYDPQVQIPWLGIVLSGPKVRSWSIAVDSNLDRGQALKRLEDFKQNVKLISGRSFALAVRTSDDVETSYNSLDKIRHFRETFPGLRIFNLAIFSELPKFCLDSTQIQPRNEPVQLEFNENYVCYMIVTYL